MPAESFVHEMLDSGVEFAVDPLAQRHTVALAFRVLTGAADDPPELTGIGAIVERTLSKGTRKYSGQALADAFDAVGAQWSSGCGRQSTVVRVLCLPEFALDCVDLVAEMICRPAFPADACRVAVELAIEERKHLDDEPQALLSVAMQKLAFGPVFGRHSGGEMDSLPRITRDAIRDHWRAGFAAGRMQVCGAGPIDADALRRRVDRAFAGFGSSERSGRRTVDYLPDAAREHRTKDLKQQYIGISLPGATKDDPRFAIEQVALGVLSGGMSARLFTEVREKQGLVYWVGAWHEQARGRGVIHLGASTTPERCRKTYDTLLRELHRLADDLTDEEVTRARNGLLAHMETEDDLTRARASNLSDDLFHFGRPVGASAKADAIRRVGVSDVEDYVRGLPRDRVCVATVGPEAL